MDAIRVSGCYRLFRFSDGMQQRLENAQHENALVQQTIRIGFGWFRPLCPDLSNLTCYEADS
jgi:hypothetical protein